MQELPEWAAVVMPWLLFLGALGTALSAAILLLRRVIMPLIRDWTKGRNDNDA